MRVRYALILLTWFLISSPSAHAQERGAPATQAAPVDPRVTPLGTQRPKQVVDDAAAKKEKEAKEKASSPVAPADTVARAAAAHGGRAALAAVRDSVATGKVTFFGARGAAGGSYDVSVTRKGAAQVERIIRQPSGDLREVSDGVSMSQSKGGLTTAMSGGPSARFIAVETGRSVESLLDADARGLAPRDAGGKDGSRVLELDEPVSNSAVALKTRFFVDDASSHVTRIEFVTGTAKNLFGRPGPATESYVYSDFRTVQGVSTPFRIERFVDGLKIEETQFTAVRFNTSVKDEVFKP